MAKVVLTHDYTHPPQDVWDVATDFASFLEAMKGLVTFEGMPTSGRVEQGQVMDVKTRLFGKLPPMDYHMEVVECDRDAMRFLSSEYGGNVKSWRHELTVTAIEGGARLTDTIEIDAGFSTPLMVLWAKLVYRRRHPVRVRILAEGGINAVES